MSKRVAGEECDEICLQVTWRKMKRFDAAVRRYVPWLQPLARFPYFPFSHDQRHFWMLMGGHHKRLSHAKEPDPPLL
jgi:hypothetical protein